MAFVVFAAIVLTACSSPVPTAVPAAAPTAVPTDIPVAAATEAPVPTAEPTIAGDVMSTATPEAAPTEAPAAAPAAVARTLKLDPSRSVARFTLDEKLMGNPVTVVGETSLVEGEITIDVAAPAQSKIGELKIDARGFKTDSGRRDGAIGRFILESVRDEYQFITFTPTKIEGLPEKADAGAPIAFKVTGDLKIRDISAPVTFDVSVTLNEDGGLTGTATAQVLRTAFNLQIPSIPSVTDVTDEVKLALEFAAVP